MAKKYSKMNISKVRQLQPFKISYSNIADFEILDGTKLTGASEARKRDVSAISDTMLSVRTTGLSRVAIEKLKDQHILKGYKTQEIARPAFPDDLRYLKTYSAQLFPKGKMLVLVNWDLYDSVKSSLNQYVMDLAYEGWFATVVKINYGTPVEVKNYIKSKAVSGVLMVGNVTASWFEMKDDFYNASSEFPCDLYYMDTNGVWGDPDGNGKFNSFTGNVTPEIWVGRLWTPTSNGNDATLINDYFARNHKYRIGQFGYSNKALAYVDDDWQHFGDCAFDNMFPASRIETHTNPVATDGDRYKAEINQHRAWAQVCSHSSPATHSFRVGTANEYVAASYLRDVNPPNSYFYNLFACSTARYTEPDYMGGWYIFDKTGNSICNGLTAVGSAKTGSMLYFENFYKPMKSGKSIGESYLEWWKALGTAHDLTDRQWFYGLTILGDPTLNWWNGVIPTLRDPFDGDVFDHYPRVMNFLWDMVSLPGSTVTYNVEVDADGAVKAGQWAAESGKTFLVSGNLSTNNYEHQFVGAQRGRWRVRACVDGIVCPWSDWRYFAFKI